MRIEVSKQEARMLCEALRGKVQALTSKANSMEATDRDTWRDLLELANDYDALHDKIDEAIGED